MRRKKKQKCLGPSGQEWAAHPFPGFTLLLALPPAGASRQDVSLSLGAASQQNVSVLWADLTNHLWPDTYLGVCDCSLGSLPKGPQGENLMEAICSKRGFPAGSVVKNPPANAEDTGSVPGREDPLRKGMATHSNMTTHLPGKSQDRGVWSTTVHGISKSWTTERLITHSGTCPRRQAKLSCPPYSGVNYFFALVNTSLIIIYDFVYFRILKAICHHPQKLK